MNKTITVEFPIEEARHIASPQPGGSMTEVAGRKTVARALAEHEAAQNPLSLPWEAVEHVPIEINNPVTTARRWGVNTAEDQLATYRLIEAQARLMAAAPELADALERWRDYMKACGWDETDACMHTTTTALKKAGR